MPPMLIYAGATPLLFRLRFRCYAYAIIDTLLFRRCCAMMLYFAMLRFH